MLAGTDNLIHDDISQFYEIPASKNSLKIRGIKVGPIFRSRQSS